MKIKCDGEMLLREGEEKNASRATVSKIYFYDTSVPPSTGSLSHLRKMLPESSSWPFPAKQPNHAT